MVQKIIQSMNRPFKSDFLASLVLVYESLPFTNQEIVKMDKELSEYEQLFMNPDVEKNLISKNELLTSFAISKAENSLLSLKEARDVYNILLSDDGYSFINQKIKDKKKLTRKDYEKLEFFNIAKTFRKLNQETFEIKQLTPQLIKNIHLQITKGLDIFHESLTDFTAYKSGKWRDSDDIRVGSYAPPSHKKIEEEVKELVKWLKRDYSIVNTAVFHTALYAIHPFHNGNKRVCRILEHILLRGLSINSKNLYSTSYYYHKQKDRYYKYLLYSLERRNLNHFTSFILEAIVLSIIFVTKTSLESKRKEFLERKVNDEKIRMVLNPLIKRRQLQFKSLFKFAKKRIARQTFVTYLQKATKNGWVNKRKQGKAVYYSLNLKVSEDKIIEKWVKFARDRIAYVPDDISLV